MHGQTKTSALISEVQLLLISERGLNRRALPASPGQKQVCRGSPIEFTAATSPLGCLRRFANALQRKNLLCRRGMWRRWSRSWPKTAGTPMPDRLRSCARAELERY